MSGGSLTGSIVSARQLPQTETESGAEQLLLLVGGALRTVDPAAASSIRFTDSKIQQQFTDYLATLSRSRNTDRRTVTIESQGGAARVAAGYITPTPIWKSSYRLVFDAQDRPHARRGGRSSTTPQAKTGENVGLSLVSGLPVSFISRLYEPRYLQRPVIQLAQDRAWTPKVHGGAVEEMAEAQVAGGRVGAFAGAPPAGGGPHGQGDGCESRLPSERQSRLGECTDGRGGLPPA